MRMANMHCWEGLLMEIYCIKCIRCTAASFFILIISFPDGNNTCSSMNMRQMTCGTNCIKSLASSLALHFFSRRSSAVLQRFSIQSNWRERVGGGEVLRWLLPLSRCQQLLLCIELCKELRSSQTNAELWLRPWHIVTALIIYPCSFLLFLLLTAVGR